MSYQWIKKSIKRLGPDSIWTLCKSSDYPKIESEDSEFIVVRGMHLCVAASDDLDKQLREEIDENIKLLPPHRFDGSANSTNYSSAYRQYTKITIYLPKRFFEKYNNRKFVVVHQEFLNHTFFRIAVCVYKRGVALLLWRLRIVFLNDDEAEMANAVGCSYGEWASHKIQLIREGRIERPLIDFGASERRMRHRMRIPLRGRMRLAMSKTKSRLTRLFSRTK